MEKENIGKKKEYGRILNPGDPDYDHAGADAFFKRNEEAIKGAFKLLHGQKKEE